MNKVRLSADPDFKAAFLGVNSQSGTPFYSLNVSRCSDSVLKDT